MENKRTTKILLAEPNDLLREVLKERLEMEGFNVSVVVDGLQLEEAIRTAGADLIITEELLPFKNGIEVIEVANQYSIPLIIISDADLESKILEAFNLGAADFIDKPFSPNEVVARSKNILRKLDESA